MPETRVSETPPLIETAAPLSVRLSAAAEKLLVLIASLKVTSTDETGVLRGLGETAAIERDVQGREDLDGRLGRGGSRLDVAGGVGRDAVEGVGSAPPGR